MLYFVSTENTNSPGVSDSLGAAAERTGFDNPQLQLIVGVAWGTVGVVTVLTIVFIVYRKRAQRRAESYDVATSAEQSEAGSRQSVLISQREEDSD